MTAPVLSPAELAIVRRFEAEDDDLDHLFCRDCRPAADVALCGADIELADETDLVTLPCVVCEDLDLTHDYVCGGA